MLYQFILHYSRQATHYFTLISDHIISATLQHILELSFTFLSTTQPIALLIGTNFISVFYSIH